MTADELKLAQYHAEGLVSKAEEEKRSFIDEAVKRARVAASAEAVQFDSRIAELRQAALESRKQWENAAEKEAVGRYPVGTVMARWKLVGVTWERNRKHVKTEDRAVYELVTATTLFPTNISYPPQRGAFIFRHLKKDGTAGLRFTAARGWELSQWLPADVNVYSNPTSDTQEVGE